MKFECVLCGSENILYKYMPITPNGQCEWTHYCPGLHQGWSNSTSSDFGSRSIPIEVNHLSAPGEPLLPHHPSLHLLPFHLQRGPTSPLVSLSYRCADVAAATSPVRHLQRTSPPCRTGGMSSALTFRAGGPGLGGSREKGPKRPNEPTNI